MYYRHDLRKRKLDISRRAFGSGSMMVWGAIFANGKSQLAILEGNQTAESYIRSLKDFLLPLIPEGRRGTIVYQQDNVTIHTAHLTKMWLLYQNIKIIDWPAHSPDLNTIENVWGLLAQRAYANGRVLNTFDELRSCILTEWQNLETETIQNPYYKYAQAMFFSLE